MIAAAATANKSFSSPAITPTSLLAVGLIARGSAVGNITAASFTPMPSTTRSAGTASKNGATAIPITFASTGSPTRNLSSEIGKASASETGSTACSGGNVVREETVSGTVFRPPRISQGVLQVEFCHRLGHPFLRAVGLASFESIADILAAGAYIDVYVCDRFVTMRHGDAYIQGDVCATRDPNTDVATMVPGCLAGRVVGAVREPPSSTIARLGERAVREPPLRARFGYCGQIRACQWFGIKT